MTYLLIMLQSSILHYKKTIKSDVGNKLVLSNIMLVSLNAINNIKGPLNMTFVPSYICTIIYDLGIIQFASSKQKKKKKEKTQRLASTIGWLKNHHSNGRAHPPGTVRKGP